MTSLPIFDRLTVSNYGMYPGTSARPGLDIDMRPGLTLVLGANGLGKTTLITMLYRMCVGPYDLSGAATGRDLGGRNIQARQISRADRRMFAARVADGAAHATATLRMNIGSGTIEATRALESLALGELRVDGETVDPTEATFHNAILERAAVPSFGDWVLLLRHLVFYFEDRRALVWDPSAQRQIIRLLFLPSATAGQWAVLERDVLQRDSRMRNLQAALSREEVALADTEDALDHSGGVRDQIAALLKLQEIDEPRLDDLNDQTTAVEAERQQARLNALKAELDHESAYRYLERQQLMAIGAAFPTSVETAQYLLAQLFLDSECLACGSTAPAAVANLHDRLAHGVCVICGTKLDPAPTPVSLSTGALARATAALDRTAERVESTSVERDTAETAFDSLLTGVQELATTVALRRARIDSLVRQLPPDEADIHKQREELAGLRGRVELMKRELIERRAAFSQFIDAVNRDIVRKADDVKRTFEGFAKGFLLEPCELVWAPHKDTVGESGQQVDYPAFELEMGGTDFVSPVRRTGPDQVSESQREFIDLAFRMTLMTVATSDGAGSLVIDAPESSLDAVFVRRAAAVLTRFADPSLDNRLVVTSNLIEGDLIPELMRKASITSGRDSRVVDLLTLAAPTAATKRLHSEYAAVRRSLFARSKNTAP